MYFVFVIIMLILLIKVQRIFNDRMSHLAYMIHGIKSHVLTKSNNLFNFLVYFKYLGVEKKNESVSELSYISNDNPYIYITPR